MLLRIFSYMGKYKKFAFLAILFVTAECVFELLVPLLMADLVDVGVANGDRAYIYAKGMQMVLCALCALVLGMGSARFSALAGQGLGAGAEGGSVREAPALFLLQHRPFPGVLPGHQADQRRHQHPELRLHGTPPLLQRAGDALSRRRGWPSP